MMETEHDKVLGRGSLIVSLVLVLVVGTTAGVVAWPRLARSIGTTAAPTPPAPAYKAGDMVDVPAAWYAKTPYTHRLNSPVQGTEADGAKLAMALLWERRHLCPGAFPVLFCHDEIVVEASADQADAAAAWLGARFARERIEAQGPAALAGWAQFFANVDHELSDAGLQWCGRELERGWRSGAIDALGAARVFLLADAQALPGARVTARDVVRELVAAQADDGGFAPAQVDPRERVEATLLAMAALARALR